MIASCVHYNVVNTCCCVCSRKALFEIICGTFGENFSVHVICLARYPDWYGGEGVREKNWHEIQLLTSASETKESRAAVK